MTGLHEAVFRWPHTDAKSVVLTGTFDQWSCSIHLTKVPSGFEGTVKIPYGDKVAYKFIVDGQWAVLEDQPTEADHVGNINNIRIAPPMPVMLAPKEVKPMPRTTEYAVETPALPVTNGSVSITAGKVSHIGQIQNSIMNPDSEAASRALEFTKTLDVPAVVEDAAAAAAPHPAVPKDGIGETFVAAFPQTVTDFVDTIAVRDGATSTLEYAASGIGTVIQTFVGVDPINADKIVYKSPVPCAHFEVPTEEREVSTEAPQVLKSELLGNTLPTSIIAVDGSDNVRKSTAAPVAIPSAVDATSTAVPSTPSVIIAHSVSESPTPTVAVEPTVATISITKEAVADTSEAALATTVPTQSNPPAVSPVAIKVDVPPEQLPTFKMVSSDPELAAVAPVVASERASHESTSEPSAPIAALEPQLISAESTPEPASTPAIGIANAVTSEAKATPAEEPSTHAHANIIQSEPKPVTPTLAVPTSETSLSVSRPPYTTDTGSELITATGNADAVTSGAEMLPSVTAETSEVPAGVVSPAAEERSTPAPGVSVEPTVPARTSGPGLVAAGDSTVPDTWPAPSSTPAAGDSKPEQLVRSPSSNAVMNGTAPAVPSTSTTESSSQLSTPVKKQEFPSSESPGSTSSSPLSSRVGTASSRKKKTSIFGKLKHMFSKDGKERELRRS